MFVSGLNSAALAAALRYRALSALIVAAFGSAWMAIGAHYLKRLDWCAGWSSLRPQRS
jgi:hypothetical protein